LATLALWFVPILNLVSLPLEYLNAHTHEMCHAITAIVTGGKVEQINVFANGSGVTPVIGGYMPMVGSAGYVGASLIGVLIILFSNNPEGARLSLRLLASALAASMLLWVRGDAVGVVSGIAWVALLFLLAAKLPAKGALFAANFVGIQQCLHSVMALLTLMDISFFTEQHSDAKLMHESTGLPASFWAVGWMVFSLALMGITLKGAWRSRAR
jgi:hypothetical protein